MEIVFLGTSSMVPTKDRNQVSFLISYGSEGILFDCGEGTQRQLKAAGIKLTKITKILITHWHGDHVLGLPGLIQSMAASNYTGILEIYGPKETKKHIDYLFKAFVFDRKIELKVQEIESGIFFENKQFMLKSIKVEHGVETLAYSFIEKDKRRIDMRSASKFNIKEGPLLGKLQEGKPIIVKGKKIAPDDVSKVEKGKKITYITDTLLCKSCYDIAKDSDLLICEATYSSKLKEKSEEYNHMTAQQAAQIASTSNTKRLVLTHFSARYKDTEELEDDAKTAFEDVICAYDLMKIKL